MSNVKHLRVSHLIGVGLNNKMDMHAIRRKNLRMIIERMGGTPAAFSRVVDVPEARLAQVLSEKYRGGKNFGEKAARTLEEAAGLAPLTLDTVGAIDVVILDGKLELIDAPLVPYDRNVTPAALGHRPIPVISAIQAGAMREIAEPYAVGAGYATLYADDEYSRWAFALEIEGESMLPDFRPGDFVIIEPEWEPRPGDCVAAKNCKEEATFKKYRQRGTDEKGNVVFELVPLNSDYPTVRSDQESLTIIGVMAEHRRKTRRR